MRKERLRLGSVLGIPLRLDLSWLLIFVWLSWSLAASYFPNNHPEWALWLNWLLGIVTSLLFFVSVLLHELGHSLVARSQGIPVRQITLFIFGGAAEITEEPSSPGKEVWLALAGPMVSLALGVVFMTVYLLARRVAPPASSVALYLGGINLTLGVFNLIPGFPLDGGRVLRAILWQLGHDLTWATRWATRAGQAVAYAFIVLGMMRAFGGDWVGGLWMAFIGLFLDGAARSAAMQLTLRNLLEGHVAAEIMSSDCQLVPPQLTLDLLVEHYLIAQNRRCYVVGNQDSVLGLVTVHQVQGVPRGNWPTTRIADVYLPLERLRTVERQTPLHQVLHEMTDQGVNQLPVMEEGKMVGMVTRDKLITFIRNRSSLGLT
jgi:Zn-dependent protease